MRRREVIALLCGVARPMSAAAQDVGKVPRVGVLDFFPSAAASDFLEPFRNGLAERGYIDGRNIQVEYRSAELSSDRAAELAADCWLFTLSPFGWPLVLAGALKAAYDLALLWQFSKVRPPEEKTLKAVEPRERARSRCK